MVYRAEWNNHIVAVKEMVYTDDQKQAFENELSLFEKVKHKNIIKLLAHSVGDSICSLIMEYADCGNMYDLLHKHVKVDYQMEHALSWSHQTAQALAYLHNMSPTPLVHRDVKPPNLLLMNFCRTVKICDFGTACDVHTHMTTNKGSAYWMAPEVFNNNFDSNSKTYTEKCDTFSYGITVWEIFARSRPHENIVNSFAVMWAVNSGGRPPSLQNCPKPLEELINRCWAHDPADRPDMSTVVKRLEQMTDLIIKSELPEIHLPQKANEIARDSSMSEFTASVPFDTASEPPHPLYAFLQSPTQNYQPFNLINTDPGGSQENLLDSGYVRRRQPSDRTCNNRVPEEVNNHLAPQVPERRPRSSSVNNRNAPENRVNDLTASRFRSTNDTSVHYDEAEATGSYFPPHPPAGPRSLADGNRGQAYVSQIESRYRPLQPDTGNATSMQIFQRHQEACHKYIKLLTEFKLLQEREKELDELQSNGQSDFILRKEVEDTHADEIQLRIFLNNLKQQLQKIKSEKLRQEAEKDGFQLIG